MNCRLCQAVNLLKKSFGQQMLHLTQLKHFLAKTFFYFNLLLVRVYNSLPQASLPLRQVLKSPWFMKGVLDI